MGVTFDWKEFLEVQLLFEVICVAIYIYVIHVLIWTKNTVFRSAFYVLFIIGGFFDVSMAIACVILRYYEKFGLCHSWEPVLRTASTLTGSNFLVHIFLNLLMTCNRLTAVWWPTSHNQIWNVHRYTPLVVILIIISFALYGVGFVIPFNLERIDDQFCAILGRPSVAKYFHFLSGLSTVIFEVICLIMSPLTIYKMFKLKKKINQGGSIKQEASLAFFSLLKAMSFTIEFIYEIVKLLGISSSESWFMEIITEQFTTYFFILVVFNGPTLFLLSPTLRRFTVKRWKKTSSTQNISVPSMSQGQTKTPRPGAAQTVVTS